MPQRKEKRNEFSTKLSLLAGGSGITDCGADVVAGQGEPAPLHYRPVWGIYGVLFLLGDWTYSLFGDKRAVHIAVGVAVVVWP